MSPHFFHFLISRHIRDIHQIKAPIKTVTTKNLMILFSAFSNILYPSLYVFHIRVCINRGQKIKRKEPLLTLNSLFFVDISVCEFIRPICSVDTRSCLDITVSIDIEI